MSLDLTSGAILVVERPQLDQKLLQTELQTLGYSPDIAPSSEKAFEAVMGKRYQLVFLEFDLQGMSGIEVAKIIRRTEVQMKWPRTIIVAYSFSDLNDLRQQCAIADIDAFFIKPTEPGALSKILNDLLENPNNQ
jgi:CheY-like chemotaxis protein